jgi:hypothetical protein
MIVNIDNLTVLKHTINVLEVKEMFDLVPIPNGSTVTIEYGETGYSGNYWIYGGK